MWGEHPRPHRPPPCTPQSSQAPLGVGWGQGVGGPGACSAPQGRGSAGSLQGLGRGPCVAIGRVEAVLDAHHVQLHLA